VRAYRFRLATVARIRALEERVAAERFMVALRDLRKAEESRRAAEVALSALEAPTGLTTMAAMTWVGDQAERLADSLAGCRASVTEAASWCAEARAAWDVAARRAGVLERLDEHGLARWREETLRQEAIELDDLSLARHGAIGVRR
jgi:flagellar export protein FliJ